MRHLLPRGSAALRIDGTFMAFIEVKRVKTKLAAKQLRQVEMYAFHEVEWAVPHEGLRVASVLT